MRRPTKPKRGHKRESTLVQQIRIDHGSRPDVLMRRQTTGAFKTTDKHGKTRVVRTGMTGETDLFIWQLRRVMAHRSTPDEQRYMPREWNEWFYYNQGIFIECKALGKDGDLSDAQKDFRDTVFRMGGEYVLALESKDVARALGPVPGWVREYQDQVKVMQDRE